MREQNTRLERTFPAICALKIKQRKIEGKYCCTDRKLHNCYILRYGKRSGSVTRFTTGVVGKPSVPKRRRHVIKC